MFVRHALKLLAIFSTIAFLTMGAGCDPNPPGPSQNCPAGWQYISTQGWWQKPNGFGTTQVPQSLPASGVGGHEHVQMCAPVNMRVGDGPLHLDLDLMTHQGFTGMGTSSNPAHSYVDVTLGNDSRTIYNAPGGTINYLNWNPQCLGKFNTDGTYHECMLHTSIDVTIPSDVPAGVNSLRVRLMQGDEPNGQRQFVSNEFPIWVRANPDLNNCGLTEGKGWFNTITYARAAITDCLPGSTPLSGTVNFHFQSRGDIAVSSNEARIDARFGKDDFTAPFWSVGGHSGATTTYTVPLNTANYTNGWHCLSVLTTTTERDANGNGTAANTGVMEVPVLFSNSGQTTADGHGACFPPT